MPLPLDVVLEASFGELGVRVANNALRELAYLSENTPTVDSSDILIARLACQLDAHCIDARATLDIPFVPTGTSFQFRAWQAISAAPCGSVITYDIIVQQIGSVPRAVGQVYGDNWFPILIPRHRVVNASGTGGSLYHANGYLPNAKHWPLCHEGVILI